MKKRGQNGMWLYGAGKKKENMTFCKGKKDGSKSRINYMTASFPNAQIPAKTAHTPPADPAARKPARKRKTAENRKLV